jgi:beta-N-acetylhexosaminidase
VQPRNVTEESPPPESSPRNDLTGQASIEAIQAGADIIISTLTPEKQIIIFNNLKDAVLSGKISQKRIDESVTRILTLKSTIAY